MNLNPRPVNRSILVFVIILLSIYLIGCKSGPSGPNGTGGAGYEALTDAGTLPRVIFTYPPDQSRGPYDYYNQFQIRFNKIMDIESFKQGIILYSAADTMELDTNTLVTDGGDMIQFSAVPVSQSALSWKIGESYSLRIPKEIMDMSGNHLRAPYTIAFMPEPHFRVTSISPRNMAINLSLIPKMRIYFNSPVDTSIISSILITPSIPVRWSFSSSMRSIASVKDTTRFEVDTQYTLTVLPSARDKFGNRLAGEFRSSFHTLPFRVSSASLRNGTIDVPKGFSQISFSLTSPIDTASIKNGISIQPPVKYYFWGTNGKSAYKILFNQSEPFASSTKYTINLTSSIRSVSDKPLFPFTLEFTTSGTP